MITALFFIGTALIMIGFWLRATTMDPLGYSPEFVYWPMLIGVLLLSICALLWMIGAKP